VCQGQCRQKQARESGHDGVKRRRRGIRLGYWNVDAMVAMVALRQLQRNALPVPTLVIGLVPHVIPATMIAAGLLERAMTEPLSHGRDEVIYLICTHPRVALGQRVDDGWRSAYRASGGIGGPFGYDTDKPWARVRFPDGVRTSALGWAVLDPLLETVEGLVDSSFDPSRDPEGEDGRHRQELLMWIYDRLADSGGEQGPDRGEVVGGQINFDLQYIGKASGEALRRASGAHHKVPLILHRTLAYDPHRLVYTLPCDIVVATYESDAESPEVKMLSLADAIAQTGIPRDLLIAAAEEAMIAAVGAPENRRNTVARRFPQSNAGDRLVELGLDKMVLAFTGIPDRVAIHGERQTIDRGSRGIAMQLPP
jgi:hypothetical protein